MTQVAYERRGAVAVLTIDNPPVNAMSPGVPAGLCRGVARANGDDRVASIVVIGAGRGFVAGADIRYFSRPWPEGEARLVDAVAALEASRKPVVAAIHGHALGGGLETAMACHYRIAAPDARLGQPEVTLGFPPGAGGTQRLPRLVGVEAALDMIVSGAPVDAGRARALGLVDAVAEGELLAAALAFAAEKGDAGPAHRRARDLPAVAGDSSVFDAKRREIARRARGRRAPQACIDGVQAAFERPFDEGVARERALFRECVRSDESRALRHVFFAERAARHVPGIAPGTPLPAPKTAGVVGAGTMGAGIAATLAGAGLAVTLVERSREALDRGMAAIEKTCAAAMDKGRMRADERARRLALIEPTLRLADLSGADIVIEAAFEEMAVKKRVFAGLDEVARPDAILASNTSYLDLDEIAAGLPRRSGRVLGMHFFSPVHAMRLLEVVRTGTVRDDVLTAAMALARRLGKLPIVARVCHGFIGNRMLEGYVREAGMMVEEGAAPERIDEAMTAFGMAMGPLAVMDLAGNDVGWRRRREAGGGVAADERGTFIANRLCERGHFGRKTGRGYYIHDEGGTPRPNPEAMALAAEARARFGLRERRIPEREIVERCLLPLVAVGARIVEEGIALRASDIDLVYIHGYGFPAWRGGPMHWAGSTGLKDIHAAMLRHRRRSGAPHWQAPRLLEDLARRGGTFEELDEARTHRDER